VLALAPALGLGLPTADLAAQAPLRVLLITGGGYHDYTNQKEIIAKGLGERINARFTVDHEAGPNSAARVSRHKSAGWVRDFDIVIYNICFADVRDNEWSEAIVREHVTHQIPAVVLHCTMHSYNYRGDSPVWSMFLGVRTQRHQRQMPYTVEALQPKHPIMVNFPAPWRTPQGELYEILDVYPTATPLAQAFGEESQKQQVTVWTNRFAGVRVFGTTIGHHNETMQTKAYMDLLASGVLWAAGKLDEAGKPMAGYGR
jgi:type 1 glutamine amidotransferase